MPCALRGALVCCVALWTVVLASCGLLAPIDGLTGGNTDSGDEGAIVVPANDAPPTAADTGGDDSDPDSAPIGPSAEGSGGEQDSGADAPADASVDAPSDAVADAPATMDAVSDVTAMPPPIVFVQ